MMQPLLKIQTVPIKIEAQTKRASLQHSTEAAPAQRPARPAQRPAPVQQRQVKPEAQPLPEQRVSQQARGAQRPATAERPVSYLQEASDAVQAYNQNIAVGGSAVSGDVQSQPADMDYVQASAANTAEVQTAGSTSFDYSMDRETFDWSTTSKPQLEYVPATIEYSVSQYPKVIIEYVGDPIYVPASANPNYEPPPETKGKA